MNVANITFDRLSSRLTWGIDKICSAGWLYDACSHLCKPSMCSKRWLKAHCNDFATTKHGLRHCTGDTPVKA